MARETIDLTALDGIEATTFDKPARLVLPNPRHGGPSLLEIRRRLAGKRYRLSGTQARIFVDIDPGPPEERLIALETIVRDEVAGLERMILSVLPYVDEIVLGIDGRSGPETYEMAEGYADLIVPFSHGDLGLTLDEWMANKIDFAKARNVSRSRVTAPWTLVLDADEYLQPGQQDIRDVVRTAPASCGGFHPYVMLGGAGMEDPHRLARTQYRWERGTHNSLRLLLPTKPIDFMIVGDTSLRTLDEDARRDEQRDRSIEDLVEGAAQGNLGDLFHLAKHRLFETQEAFEAGVKLAEDYRTRVELHSILADDRAWLALMVALQWYQRDNILETERWACRALLDGPSCVAFCILGDCAEDRGDLQQAHDWYVCACNVEDLSKVKWPGITDVRYGRLAGIKMALRDPAHYERVLAETEPFVPSDA